MSSKINAYARFLNSLAAIKRSYGTIEINKDFNSASSLSSSSSVSPSSQQYPIPFYTKTIRVNTSFNNGNSIGSSSATAAEATTSAATANVDVKDNKIGNNVDENVTPASRYYRQLGYYYYI